MGRNGICQLSGSSPFFGRVARLVRFARRRTLALHCILSALSSASLRIHGLHHGLRHVCSFNVLGTARSSPTRTRGLRELCATLGRRQAIILESCDSTRDGYASSHIIRPCVFLGNRGRVQYFRAMDKRGGAFGIDHVKHIRLLSLL